MDIHELLKKAMNANAEEREVAVTQILTLIHDLLIAEETFQQEVMGLVKRVKELEGTLASLGIAPNEVLTEQDLDDMRQKLGRGVYMPYSPTTKTILDIMSQRYD